jgi:hypothetical protein
MGLVAQPSTEPCADSHAEGPAHEADQPAYGATDRCTGTSNLVVLTFVSHVGPFR